MENLGDFAKFDGHLTESALASLEQAGLIAHKSGVGYVGTEHLLLGILSHSSSMGAQILASRGITYKRIHDALELTPQALTVVVAFNGVNKDIIDIIRTAWHLAIEHGQEKLGTEHLVYSMLTLQESRATRLLEDLSVDIVSLRSSLEDIFDKQQSEATNEAKVNSSAPREIRMLEKYGIDLTSRAEEGLLDPMVGRGQEVNRLITVLGRRSKSNPALIGEPGVGKTAIVEGLAQRIADRKVPTSLLNKRIVRLDLSALVAGAKYRGEFEERLQKLISTVVKHPEIILFIDELHLLVGTGSAEGSMDAANALKPALARGEIKVIGATTFDEYRKYIEKDSALARRFQPVTVAEPTVEVAVEMVKAMAGKLAVHHQITISDELVKLAVDLSQRYINDRQLPDKAIDVLDEASSLLRANEPVKLSRRQKMAQQIRQLSRKIDSAVESADYKKAAEYKVQMSQLENRVKDLPADSGGLPNLTEDYLRRAISAITNTPLERLKRSELRGLAKLEKRLDKFVIGQTEATGVLARSIRRAKSGLSRSSGPLGSFIFLGPTGVGKTEMARVLAREVFGGDNSLIKIDMSEFGERHTASKLIGAPAGYVGYDDGGTLLERVRRQPYSVVLFDEIEKAHTDVLNLLLQILEDGQLTDSHGRTVSFRQSIVILTSNVGAERMLQETELGFAPSKKSREMANVSHEHNSKVATQELEQFMKPELISRFDNIIVYKPLTKMVVGKIFDNIIKEMIDNMANQKVSLKITPSAKKHVINLGFDSQRGARVLRRTIQSEIGDPLSDVLISGEAGAGDTLEVQYRGGRIRIDVKSPVTA